MLCVSVLRSCGDLLCEVNILSGQCVVLSTCIVILTYHLLYRSVDVTCSESLIHIGQSLICIITENIKRRCAHRYDKNRIVTVAWFRAVLFCGLGNITLIQICNKKP